jgi:hypothetical protein
MKLNRYFIITCSALLLSSCGNDSVESTVFELKIQNISTASTFIGNDGNPIPVVLLGGVGAVSTEPNPLYAVGQKELKNGFEKYVEDVDPSDLITSLQSTAGVTQVIGTRIPEQEDGVDGIIRAGESFRVLFSAESNKSQLNFALAFIQGNDTFIGTNSGISLFNSRGTPVSGDITNRFLLLDAGTEVNEAPGNGQNQPFNQENPGDGQEENLNVRPVDDGFSYPITNSMIKVTITPVEELSN